MHATQTVRPQLARAAQSVAAAHAEWEKFRHEPATAEDITEAADREAHLRDEVAALTGRFATLPGRLRFALLRLLRGTQQFLGLDPRQAWATAYLIGVPAVALVLPVVLLFRPAGITGAAILLGTYFAAVCIASALLLSVRHEGPDAAIARLRKERAAKKVRAADAVVQLAAARERLDFLRGAHAAQVAYEQAVADHTALDALLASERYQLDHTDWQSFRGAEFEAFVMRVFRMLGYEVRATKPRAGHGVDLIARGHGRTIAVHAATTDDGVGNGAVQEVFAGSTYHRCEECAVVTNSRFTSGAIDLAAGVGCRLVDAARIPALIAGDVY